MKIFLILLYLAITFASCTKTVYVPVQNTHTDTLKLTQIHIDSIYYHDSIYVTQKAVGDTIYNTKYVTKYRDRWQLRYDTVYQSRTDTITKVQKVEVERQKTFKEKLDDFFLSFIIAALALALSFFFFARPRK